MGIKTVMIVEGNNTLELSTSKCQILKQLKHALLQGSKQVLGAALRTNHKTENLSYPYVKLH